jgi:hypothetical protein
MSYLWPQVENNARVGVFMLSLRQLTQSFLPADLLLALTSTRLSWPIVCSLGALLFLAPSWLVRNGWAARRWPECADIHYKNA